MSCVYLNNNFTSHLSEKLKIPQASINTIIGEITAMANNGDSSAKSILDRIYQYMDLQDPEKDIESEREMYKAFFEARMKIVKPDIRIGEEEDWREPVRGEDFMLDTKDIEGYENEFDDKWNQSLQDKLKRQIINSVQKAMELNKRQTLYIRLPLIRNQDTIPVNLSVREIYENIHSATQRAVSEAIETMSQAYPDIYEVLYDHLPIIKSRGAQNSDIALIKGLWGKGFEVEITPPKLHKFASESESVMFGEDAFMERYKGVGREAFNGTTTFFNDSSHKELSKLGKDGWRVVVPVSDSGKSRASLKAQRVINSVNGIKYRKGGGAHQYTVGTADHEDAAKNKKSNNIELITSLTSHKELLQAEVRRINAEREKAYKSNSIEDQKALQDIDKEIDALMDKLSRHVVHINGFDISYDTISFDRKSANGETERVTITRGIPWTISKTTEGYSANQPLLVIMNEALTETIPQEFIEAQLDKLVDKAVELSKDSKGVIFADLSSQLFDGVENIDALLPVRLNRNAQDANWKISENDRSYSPTTPYNKESYRPTIKTQEWRKIEEVRTLNDYQAKYSIEQRMAIEREMSIAMRGVFRAIMKFAINFGSSEVSWGGPIKSIMYNLEDFIEKYKEYNNLSNEDLKDHMTGDNLDDILAIALAKGAIEKEDLWTALSNYADYLSLYDEFNSAENSDVYHWLDDFYDFSMMFNEEMDSIQGFNVDDIQLQDWSDSGKAMSIFLVDYFRQFRDHIKENALLYLSDMKDKKEKEQRIDPDSNPDSADTNVEEETKEGWQIKDGKHELKTGLSAKVKDILRALPQSSFSPDGQAIVSYNERGFIQFIDPNHAFNVLKDNLNHYRDPMKFYEALKNLENSHPWIATLTRKIESEIKLYASKFNYIRSNDSKEGLIFSPILTSLYSVIRSQQMNFTYTNDNGEWKDTDKDTVHYEITEQLRSKVEGKVGPTKYIKVGEGLFSDKETFALFENDLTEVALKAIEIPEVLEVMYQTIRDYGNKDDISIEEYKSNVLKNPNESYIDILYALEATDPTKITNEIHDGLIEVLSNLGVTYFDRNILMSIMSKNYKSVKMSYKDDYGLSADRAPIMLIGRIMVEANKSLEKGASGTDTHVGKYLSLFDKFEDILKGVGALNNTESMIRIGDDKRYKNQKPSFLSDMIDSLRNTRGLDPEAYKAFLDKEYGQYEWYKMATLNGEDNGDLWNGFWLEQLYNDPNSHKTDRITLSNHVSFKGKEYSKWTVADHYEVMLQNYFYSRIPNKKGEVVRNGKVRFSISPFADSPVAEFIDFNTLEYRLIMNPSRRILDKAKMKKTLEYWNARLIIQEMERMFLVQARAKDNTIPLSQRIANFDGKRGMMFHHFPELNAVEDKDGNIVSKYYFKAVMDNDGKLSHYIPIGHKPISEEGTGKDKLVDIFEIYKANPKHVEFYSAMGHAISVMTLDKAIGDIVSMQEKGVLNADYNGIVETLPSGKYSGTDEDRNKTVNSILNRNHRIYSSKYSKEQIIKLLSEQNADKKSEILSYLHSGLEGNKISDLMKAYRLISTGAERGLLNSSDLGLVSLMNMNIENVDIDSVEDPGLKEALPIALLVKELYSNIIEDSYMHNLMDFYSNTKYASSQIIQLFDVDLAMFKSDVDFIKRHKQIYAPASRLMLVSMEYYDSSINDALENSITIKDIEVQVKEADDIRAIQENSKSYTPEQIETIYKAMNSVNSTDGQSFRTLHSYMNIVRASSGWSQEVENVYQKITEYDKQMAKYLKGDTTITTKPTLDLTAEERMTVFQAIKPYMFTHSSIAYNNTVGSQNVTTNIKFGVQHKNSESPILALLTLFPNVVKVNPAFHALNMYIQDSRLESLRTGDLTKEIHVVHTESVVKVGGNKGHIDIEAIANKVGVGWSKNDGRNVLVKHNEFSKLLRNTIRENGGLTRLSYSNYGEQSANPEHLLDHMIAIGTQMKMIVASDFADDVTFKVDGKELKLDEFLNKYNHLFIARTVKAFKGVEGRIGSLIGLSETLKREAMKNPERFDQSFLEAIELAKNENGELEFKGNIFDPSYSTQVHQLINSLIRKAIVKHEISGGNAVLTSNVLGTKELSIQYKYKTVVDENGNEKKVAESVDYVPIMMPAYSKRLYEKFMNDDGTINYGEMAKESPELLNAIGYRIPTEAQYSMMPLKIVGFLPPYMGSTVLMPDSYIELAGWDFDIDKLYILLPTITEQLDHKAARKAYDEYVKEFQENYSEELPQDEDGNMLEYGGWVYGEKEEYSRLGANIGNGNPYDMSTAQINNRIIDYMLKMLRHPDSAQRMMNKGGFSEIEAIAKEMHERTMNGNQSIAPDSPAGMAYYREQNMTGITLVGVMASHNKNHSMLQHSHMAVSSSFHIIGKDADGNKTDDFFYELSSKTIPYKGTDLFKFKSKSISEFLAASVDNAKNPVLGMFGINMNNVNAAMLMVRLGYNIRDIALMLNQPASLWVNDHMNSSGKSYSLTLKTVRSKVATLIERVQGKGVNSTSAKNIGRDRDSNQSESNESNDFKDNNISTEMAIKIASQLTDEAKRKNGNTNFHDVYYNVEQKKYMLRTEHSRKDGQTYYKERPYSSLSYLRKALSGVIGSEISVSDGEQLSQLDKDVRDASKDYVVNRSDLDSDLGVAIDDPKWNGDKEGYVKFLERQIKVLDILSNMDNKGQTLTSYMINRRWDVHQKSIGKDAYEAMVNIYRSKNEDLSGLVRLDLSTNIETFAQFLIASLVLDFGSFSGY